MIRVLVVDDYAILRAGLKEILLRDLDGVVCDEAADAHPEDQYGKRVLQAGASGYLKKESAPEELIRAIRTVLAGGRYVSPFLAERLALDYLKIRAALSTKPCPSENLRSFG